MQNRYVGDIGDFGKYGLLRSILSPPSLRLGVNWYLTPDEVDNSDGTIISYLLDSKKNHKRFKECDPELFDKLQEIVKPKRVNDKVISQGKRKIKKIETEKILPVETVFYDDELNLVKNRDEWVKNGFTKLRNCDVIFFDPDNGFPVYNNKKGKYNIEKHHKKSPKYIYHDEIVEYYKRGQSLIIYQHRDMKDENEYLNRFRRIKQKRYIPEAQEIFHLKFHRYRVRDYAFVLTPSHKNTIRSKVGEMLKNPWGKHFTYHELI